MKEKMRNYKKIKELTKLQKIKSKFSYDDEDNIIIQHYGIYKNGLTIEEIKDYIRARAGKLRIETLYKKFCSIAGCNTMTSYHCPCCDYNRFLMYRWDVERFCNVLFGVISETYFD